MKFFRQYRARPGKMIMLLVLVLALGYLLNGVEGAVACVLGFWVFDYVLCLKEV